MAEREPLPAALEEIATAVVDSAFVVHSTLGPGLLESVYETCLDHELQSRGLSVERQVPVPIVYKDVRLSAGLRLDLIVEQSVIIEVKAVEKLLPVHKAQMLTYLKLQSLRIGFLLNFNVPLIRDGITRVVL